MLRRRYVQMFKFGHFDTNFDVLFQAAPDFLGHGLVAREIAEQSIVLLKNENNILPLNAATLKSVALIGAEWFAARRSCRLGRSGQTTQSVVAPYTVTPREGLRNVLRAMGSAATVTYKSGGGTGTKADRDAAVELAQRSDVVIVMVGDNPHELCDRETLGLPIIPPADPNFCAWDESHREEPMARRSQRGTNCTEQRTSRGKGTDQETLMKDLVAAPGVAQKMVVVLKTEGMVLMPWLDKIPSLLRHGIPGQEDGNAVADILFGLRNPSGKLPMTFGNSATRGGLLHHGAVPRSLHRPATLVGPATVGGAVHRRAPDGLSVVREPTTSGRCSHSVSACPYTTFAYSGLSVATAIDQQTGRAVLSATYTITNTGTRRGAETSQVYLTLPLAAGEPSKRLVGFQKVDLMPGASQQVLVAIDSSQSNHPLSYWVPLNDAPVPGWSQGSWSRAYGDYTVHVGTSSANTALEQSVTLPGLVPGGCMTVQPGPAWVCVNGGGCHRAIRWGGGPTPPPSPTPPTACTTVQPGPAWVCVNGGWLPPGHPGAGGGATPPPSLTPPTACTTVQPGPAWVCVNGGWLPPGHPGAGGGATPPPSLTPPTACTTVQPGPAWVCVNGGWLPPGHPGAGGGPAPLIPNS